MSRVIRANPRQVLPRKRPPWRAAVAFATGQNRKSLSMPLRPVLPDADIERGRSLRTLATPQAWWPLPIDRISRDGRDHASPLPRALHCRKDRRLRCGQRQRERRARGHLYPRREGRRRQHRVRRDATPYDALDPKPTAEIRRPRRRALAVVLQGAARLHRFHAGRAGEVCAGAPAQVRPRDPVKPGRACPPRAIRPRWRVCPARPALSCPHPE